MTEAQRCAVGLVGAVEKKRQWPRDPRRFTKVECGISFQIL